MRGSADTHVLFWRFYCFLSFNQTVHKKQEDTEEELKPPGDYASATMITYATLALTLTHTCTYTQAYMCGQAYAVDTCFGQMQADRRTTIPAGTQVHIHTHICEYERDAGSCICTHTWAH